MTDPEDPRMRPPALFGRPEVMILRRYAFGETAAAYAYGSVRILADCGHEAWIAPSGVVFLSRHPKILTVCTECMPTGEMDVAVAPGTREELAARFGVARADQLIAEVTERGREGRLKGWDE